MTHRLYNRVVGAGPLIVAAVVSAVVSASVLLPSQAFGVQHLPMPAAKSAVNSYAEEETAGHPEDTYRIYNCRRRSGPIIWCAIRWHYPASRDDGPGAEGFYVLHTRIVAQRKPDCLLVWEVLWEDKRCVSR